MISYTKTYTFSILHVVLHTKYIVSNISITNVIFEYVGYYISIILPLLLILFGQWLLASPAGSSARSAGARQSPVWGPRSSWGAWAMGNDITWPKEGSTARAI